MDVILVPRVLLHDHSGRVLTLRRANSIHGQGLLNLPGGKHEKGTMLESIVEELGEETGVTISELLAHAHSFWYQNRFPPKTSEKNAKTYQEFFLTASVSDLSRLRLMLDNESSESVMVSSEDYLHHVYAFHHEVALARHFKDAKTEFAHYSALIDDGTIRSTDQLDKYLAPEPEIIRRAQTLSLRLTGNLITDPDELRALDDLGRKYTPTLEGAKRMRRAYVERELAKY